MKLKDPCLIAAPIVGDHYSRWPGPQWKFKQTNVNLAAMKPKSARENHSNLKRIPNYQKKNISKNNGKDNSPLILHISPNKKNSWGCGISCQLLLLLTSSLHGMRCQMRAWNSNTLNDGTQEWFDYWSPLSDFRVRSLLCELLCRHCQEKLLLLDRVDTSEPEARKAQLAATSCDSWVSGSAVLAQSPMFLCP